ncbi:putative adenylyltransferase/sulfurtransferase MoeZ [Tsuneonella dongtanensis]|uniref:Putative adenylyltransferase/sulfurtransferase MoeZ n=1 Tax=Tsuneonella dongtanensis TaxID=692370 RepID=A0A1B2ABZ9_9SPHN|nr:rhodanese-like domain-containing protein [Tsuneonella dongtanensis]ANY19683.1 putative adenylyltransferase/sulfurtransferase MoeZ [Tsuneonella dongtanensis]
MTVRTRLSVAAAALALAVTGCSTSEANTAAADVASVSEGIASLDARQLGALVDAGKVVLVDVRTPEEFAEGHIAGAVNMPLDQFEPGAVPQVADKQTVLYCRSGKRSLTAAEMLEDATGSAVHLAGGILAWQESGRSVTALQ